MTSTEFRVLILYIYTYVLSKIAPSNFEGINLPKTDTFLSFSTNSPQFFIVVQNYLF